MDDVIKDQDIEKEPKRNGQSQDCDKNKGKRNLNHNKNRRRPDYNRVRKGSEPGNTKGIPMKNDYTFYAATEQIAKDIASIPFNYINGTNLDLDITTTINTDGASDTSVTINKATPGVAVIDYLPSIGITTKRTDGVNMAAIQLYTYNRHKNSGATNYEAPDLMMYVLAMKDIYAEYFECKRLLGLARLYTFHNHNLPDLIFRALRISANDIRDNIAQYRGRLNLLAEKINSFGIPKYFKAFERAAYINSFIFSDSSSDRGQFFIFRKHGYYKWSGSTSETGTELQYNTSYPSGTGDSENTVLTLEAKLNVLESMIDAIYLDSDAQTMSGDLLKAFTDAELYQVADTPEDYAVYPKFDEDILAQIENMVLFQAIPGNPTSDTFTTTLNNLNVTQSNQIIQFNPTLTVSHSRTGQNAINFRSTVFNSHKDNPDYRDVLEWSRLIPSIVETIDSTNQIVTKSLTSSGLEIPLNMILYSYNNDGTAIYSTVQQVRRSAPALAAYRNILDLMSFDWHPFLYAVGDADNPNRVGGDMKVTTLMNRSTIERINQSAIYASFYGAHLYSTNPGNKK